MPSTYLSDHKAPMGWQEVGSGEKTLIWLPGIGFPAAGFAVHILQSTGHDLMLTDPHGFAKRLAGILAP
ncbi:MAG: hypothetical protein PVI41_05685 [Roseobacter sp.]